MTSQGQRLFSAVFCSHRWGWLRYTSSTMLGKAVPAVRKRDRFFAAAWMMRGRSGGLAGERHSPCCLSSLCRSLPSISSSGLP